jgi:hypothetical protein
VTVWAVTCKSDGSLIALYATRALADHRRARAYYPDTLVVSEVNVLADDGTRYEQTRIGDYKPV